MKTKITLDYPVEMMGETVTELSIRRVKVRDQVIAAKAGGTNQDKEVRLFANLCEVSPQVIEELDMVDYRKVQEIYDGFLS
ncbi:phage tail assembly protein [Desulfovibrio subterraneus]|uniref:Phage tail assembly protein n=1 Tax=Desulfovibrio subterraneus TaxID=2718620 RepID=A0A7J0BLT5_9BACT|nr:phage tail assembly protein [Desulfovibrio subterraneus]GFM34024.1 hypothetical protein DSM101010T_23890 [Desulfovibrio subterraneus]